MFHALKRHLIRPNRNKERKIKIDDITLTVDPLDEGGMAYDCRQSFEERQNPFYADLANTLNPTVAVDIGANYGFTALVVKAWLPNAKQILVEPDVRVGRFLKANIGSQDPESVAIILAACGERDENTSTFSINPTCSQDNRIQGETGWTKTEVPMVTLDSLLKNCDNERVYIKVDTQGFEPQVFEGAINYLNSSNQWLIKAEFAPHWLASQGNDATEFLLRLIRQYRVVEAPGRTRYMHDTIRSMFRHPLPESGATNFCEYAAKLNRDSLGWVDIYVAPQKFTSWLDDSRQDDQSIHEPVNSRSEKGRE